MDKIYEQDQEEIIDLKSAAGIRVDFRDASEDEIVALLTVIGSLSFVDRIVGLNDKYEFSDYRTLEEFRRAF